MTYSTINIYINVYICVCAFMHVYDSLSWLVILVPKFCPPNKKSLSLSLSLSHMKYMKKLEFSYMKLCVQAIPLDGAGLGPTFYKSNLIRSSSIDFFHTNKK